MKLKTASVAMGPALVAALVLSGHAGPALAADAGWAPLAFSDDPEATWAEHSIDDYYVATTTIRSSTISLGEVPTPKLLIHTDVPTADIGCTALYVKDADYDSYEQVTPALIEEIEERRQVMSRLNLAKARGLPVRLIVSKSTADRFTESDGDGPRFWRRILRASVR